MSTSQARREYNRDWMRDKRKKQYAERNKRYYKRIVNMQEKGYTISHISKTLGISSWMIGKIKGGYPHN